jgi:hypothetical protein
MNKPSFITIDNVRIKLSNIKSYGLSDLVYNYVVEEEIVTPKSKLERRMHKVAEVFTDIQGFFVEDKEELNKLKEESRKLHLKNVVTIKEKEEQVIHYYLYITTYQKDNYKFYYPQVDIYEKLEELDRYFT